MRVTSMLAGLAFGLAACGGGEQKAGEQQTTTTSDQAAPAADTPAPGGDAAPAAGGTTHDVNMVLEGSSYKYVPDQLTIKSGDVVRFHNVSGGPHNVSFWADSIPSGAADALKAGMPDQMAPLEGSLITEPNGIYTVNFGKAPAGEYKFYCLPHLALGMKGKLTVQ
jgi:plastocyanin